MEDWRTYGAKLRDPRWQRKRLEVLERDRFACRWCGATDQTLHVHHLTYAAGADPWEYPLENFLTLCETCHQDESEQRAGAEWELLASLRRAGVPWDGLTALAAGFDASEARLLMPWILSWALRPDVFEVVVAVATKNPMTADDPVERERWWRGIRSRAEEATHYPEHLPALRAYLHQALDNIRAG